MRANIAKYRHCILSEHWFEYKFIKKCINNAKEYHPDIIDESEECCICLENKQLMHMLCCKQPIHYTCLLQTIAYNESCPLCRSNVFEYILHNQKHFDAQILSLLSHIQLNIMKIQRIVNMKLIKNPMILEKYCHINYTAVIKICKKIRKKLDIDVSQYFIEFMHKTNVLKCKETKQTSCSLS
jgi:hypothetical protein